VQATEKGLVVTGNNLTTQTTVRVDGVPLPTRLARKDQVVARLTPGQVSEGSDVRVDLADGLRESNALLLTVRRPSLTRLYPASTAAGRAFNMRADGSAVLTIDGQGVGDGTVVLFDSVRLPTTAKTERWLTAMVAPSLIAQPGRHTVRLRNAFGDSNALEFEVTAPTPLDPFGGPPVEVPPISGPPPQALALDSIAPPRARVGQGFNVQPGGHSALALTVRDAVPGTVVVFGNLPLATTFGSDHLLTAIVPTELLQQPGRYPVYLKYDATESNRLEFVIDR
jgi:hypothetical protein